MEIRFATAAVMKDGLATPCIRFQSETRSKLYEVSIFPDGSVAYYANGPVYQLPKTAATTPLLETVRTLKPDALNLLNLPYDSPEYRTAWWALKHKIRELVPA